MPLFYLVAPATPIASKPVQCTDLVDASESRKKGKSTLEAIQIALGNSSKLMRLNIFGLASQGKGTIDKFPPEGFRLLVLLQSSCRLTVITRPSLEAGSRRSCYGSLRR